MRYETAILIDFIKLNSELKRLIFEWRNSKFVASKMVNKRINLKQHLNFLKSLSHDKTRKYYLITAVMGGCDAMLGL
ncbi:hypothetical protein [Campylobacter sp. 19-13652]|uniref:hypothetical protein n=1 Tax=Campylobacter sp. 19-13652 TaxID=2840180 RepID=UPI001C777BDB|nr:hypothetical protein [Campylobacter sp. 19-13652]BCX80082.1 hypothetical protein LBC_15440 [Campylobacter sp. 19-13652]